MNQIIHSYQIYKDQLQHEKSTATITCHPFNISVRIFQGDVLFSWANEIVEAISGQVLQTDRIKSMAYILKENYLNKYGGRIISQNLLKEIQNDTELFISDTRAAFSDFDYFYYESLVKGNSQ